MRSESDDLQGQVDLRACQQGVTAPPNEPCGGPATPWIIAAVCGDLEAHNTLTLRDGSLAVSGVSRIAAPLRIEGGSFTSVAGIDADDTEDVTGDLATAGDWLVRAPAHVGGEAIVGGRLDASNTVQITGVLHAVGDLTHVSAESVKPDARTVANPVACNASPVTQAAMDRLEAPGIVDLGAALSHHTSPAVVSLGCARYRFLSWQIDSELTLHVAGATLIAIDGDVHIAAPVHVELEANATLELVVAGALHVDSVLTFEGGSTLLAVGGAARFAAPTRLTGFLYAPSSSVAVDNTLDITGSLFTGPLRVAAPLNVSALRAATASVSN